VLKIHLLWVIEGPPNRHPTDGSAPATDGAARGKFRKASRVRPSVAFLLFQYSTIRISHKPRRQQNQSSSVPLKAMKTPLVNRKQQHAWQTGKQCKIDLA
jgi:hypothetical protein